MLREEWIGGYVYNLGSIIDHFIYLALCIFIPSLLEILHFARTPSEDLVRKNPCKISTMTNSEDMTVDTFSHFPEFIKDRNLWGALNHMTKDL